MSDGPTVLISLGISIMIVGMAWQICRWMAGVEMTESIKQQFIAELEPLLIASEKAFVAGDATESKRLSLEMLKLAQTYADKLDPADFHDALNNPTANAIAKRLGVQPR